MNCMRKNTGTAGSWRLNYKPTFEMFRTMFKWTNDFERNKNKYEDMLLSYKHKLIRIKSDKELAGRQIC